MTNDLITPSWQDVAERWKGAYQEAQAKLDRITAVCEPFRITNEIPDEGITDTMRLASRVRAIIEEES